MTLVHRMGAKRGKTLPLPQEWKDAIEAARIASGLPDWKAARKVGISGSTWHRVMNDKGSWPSVLKMTQHYGIDPPKLTVPTLVSEDDLVGRLLVLARRLHQLGDQKRLAELVDLAAAEVLAAERTARMRGGKA